MDDGDDDDTDDDDTDDDTDDDHDDDDDTDDDNDHKNDSYAAAGPLVLAPCSMPFGPGPLVQALWYRLGVPDNWSSEPGGLYSHHNK